ncbi:MAG: rhomboid family intramembrane serine protease [Variibacter sp.]|nr:rhomboid family intramembrane serine protease [Variibacter sp.]
MASHREPIFNIPAVVTLTIAALALAHAIRVYGLSVEEERRFVLLFAFIPARYDSSLIPHSAWPGGIWADIWTFVTYAFIHGDWVHFALNAIWLLAFGTAVARRFGALRFLTFFVITAAAGAGAHLATHMGDLWPMGGASAAVSGFMAGAVRFVFHAGGPLSLMRRGGAADYAIPAAPLGRALRDPRVLVFLGAWFALNLIFGATSFSLGEEGQSVAWQAHIGGFVAGLLLFPIFDPVGRRPRARGDDSGIERMGW